MTTTWFLGIVLLAFVQEWLGHTAINGDMARFPVSAIALALAIPAWRAIVALTSRYARSELRIVLSTFLLGHLWLLGNAIRVVTYNDAAEHAASRGAAIYWHTVQCQDLMIYPAVALIVAFIVIALLAITAKIRSRTQVHV